MIDKCQNVDGLPGFKLSPVHIGIWWGHSWAAFQVILESRLLHLPSLASAWGKTMDSYP